jgi:DNA polymerase
VGKLQELPECKRCGELYLNRNMVVAETLCKKPKNSIVFLGEAPGRDEDMIGEPFVGRSGKLLRKTIEKLRQDLKSEIEPVYLNIVKCRPPNNRRPKQIEILNCNPWLKLQLETLQPLLITPLGRSAIESIMPDVKQFSLFFLIQSSPRKLNGRTYIFNFHPSFILRGGGENSQHYQLFERTLKKSFDVAIQLSSKES